MRITTAFRRGALALAIGLTIATAAIAGDETTIRVRTAAGQVERVTIEDIGGFAVGEGRALTTETGHYALLRREPERYVLEVAGERFELLDFATEPGDAAQFAMHREGDERHVVIHRREGEAGQDGKHEAKRIVRVVGHDGEAGHVLRHGDLERDLDVGALDGDGPRIAVMRRVTKDSTVR